MYWTRAVDAQEARDDAEQVYYEALVSEFDDGRYAALLKADAALSIDVSLPGTVVVAHRYAQQDRVLVKGEPRYLGRAPLREARLAPGSYSSVEAHGLSRRALSDSSPPRAAREDLGEPLHRRRDRRALHLRARRRLLVGR